MYIEADLAMIAKYTETTIKNTSKLTVPCRVYSNSCFGTLPGWAGLSGAFRSMACSEVASSTLTV